MFRGGSFFADFREFLCEARLAAPSAALARRVRSAA
jgi:hypothetical protein